MLYAYDTFLQEVVSSELAAQNSADEPYRYECACCGEEVFVAAKYSNSMVAHFRHRSGNNDVDCENYLGKYGLVSVKHKSQKRDREKVEYYFNSTTKCFYIGLRFNEDEILNYESGNVKLEIRTRKDVDPFFIQKIDRTEFCSNYTKMVILEAFSPVYYISNTFNSNKRAHIIFHENAPSFFKIQGVEKDFYAKMVRSEALYTGIRYFVAFVGGNGAQLKLKKLLGVEIEQEFDFISMGKHIWASVITITNKTSEIEDAFEEWGYKLDTPEYLTLLWPPSYEIGGVNFISTGSAFLSSSFRIQPCGNINTESKNIQSVDNNITKINVDKHIKILRKNAEIEIYVQKANLVLKENNVNEQFAKSFTIPQGNKYYLFSGSGIRELSYGENVVLPLNSYICEYSNGRLIRIIKALQNIELKGKELLIDIIKHYKVSEPYKNVCVVDKPDFIVSYINNCRQTGKINSLVKQYIEEGKL